MIGQKVPNPARVELKTIPVNSIINYLDEYAYDYIEVITPESRMKISVVELIQSVLNKHHSIITAVIESVEVLDTYGDLAKCLVTESGMIDATVLYYIAATIQVNKTKEGLNKFIDDIYRKLSTEDLL